MTTYTQLQVDIADWMARQDLPAASFIRMAEAEMNRILRVQAMQTVSILSPVTEATNGWFYADLPTDWLEFDHLEQGGISLEYLDTNQFTADAGYPTYVYTIADDKFYTTGAADVDAIWYQRVAALSDTNQTNWFTDYGYDALLMLSLDYASIYIAEHSPIYREKGMSRLRELQLFDEQSRVSGAPLVTRG